MPAESFFRAQTRIAIIFVGLGTMLIASGCAVGCHGTAGADVVATVNGKEILRADLEKQYRANLGNAPQEPAPEQADILRLNTLRDMIDQEIVQQRAAKLNLTASDEDVNAKLTEIKTPYTQEEFDRQLKQRGMTLDDLKGQIRRNLTQTKLLNKEILSKINITDAEIAAYYDLHKADTFNNIEPKLHVAQIIVTGTPPQQGNAAQPRRPPNEAEAKKEIDSIRERIQAGEDFGTLASQFSENEFASNGGDRGSILESQLKNADPAVYSAVNALRPGQITQALPVTDPNSHKVLGYQLFKLLERDPAGQRDLKDPRVQQFIRQQLRDAKAQLLENAYSEMLHDQAKIRNYFAEEILKKGAQ